ncbi:S41 family peptidase [Candidatus Berkelbacteria bacterium CG_4_9_14_3_um_filter_39_23]|uniref:S41 family peptidase n=2 Tax=Candidatus Berkelbacteria TaxID=1618330 RepID=A0A2M7CIP5_9BACT|nr:S41 family peptidase [Candidatus Berkelbacteria bacterium]OIP05884.1 MAG: hypothetical protein AUK14_00775 [Candidatus Berkelbacteria bacterium CG2_30_39_44]PIR27643.1 MAG: peptidase S41 [Candidatus Berkelbacteria bacterium CG11_big_fil_rev_8_21_14_0_20_40_23]PIV25526.1 MAG: S41 family peptidase [Candidatus Berkelbacteria bacterium CG03_land_8_20_14_0_80_40_36]PIX30676.1 MAG: S41 family peptidase [Candidatus Berkelbacteria bacterium CG_4_8_14_3_um_filter_39_27]PIZ28505.1 MAG: S41 family pep
MSNRNKYLFLFLFIVSFSTGYGLGYKNIQARNVEVVNRQSADKEVDFDLFWQVWSRVKEKTIGEIKPKEMVYGAIKGMVASLKDPFSVYFNPDEAKEFLSDVNGEFEGIGAELAVQDENLTVVAPLDGSPAKEAGLLPKDVIVAIDDVASSTINFDEAIAKIRGEKGSQVKLTLARPGKKETFNLIITRSLIKVDSVKSEIRADGIGVIKISQFSSDTFAGVKNALGDFEKAGVKGMVLDMRNNPGGLFDSSVNVASLFIPEGVVVSEQGRAGKEDFRTTQKAVLSSVPLKVLINAGSASAAEIVAGAIKDSGRGKLIGQKSFGKGTIQDLVDFPDKSSLKITIAKWLTPSGSEIDKKGIEPDISVENNPSEKDLQMEKAIAELGGSL